MNTRKLIELELEMQILCCCSFWLLRKGVGMCVFKVAQVCVIMFGRVLKCETKW